MMNKLITYVSENTGSLSAFLISVFRTELEIAHLCDTWICINNQVYRLQYLRIYYNFQLFHC